MTLPFATLLAGTLFASSLVAQSGHARIRVTDVRRQPIPNAEATLLGANNKAIQTETANGAGEIVFSDLPFGASRFWIDAPGFKRYVVTVKIRNGDEVQVKTRLDVNPPD